MKETLLKVLFEAFMKVIMTLVENLQKKDEEIQEVKEKAKKDIALAESVRKAYPTLSDEKIVGELC